VGFLPCKQKQHETVQRYQIQWITVAHRNSSTLAALILLRLAETLSHGRCNGFFQPTHSSTGNGICYVPNANRMCLLRTWEL